MHPTNLRKIGGSAMLAMPPAILDLLHLSPGATVGVAVDAGRPIVEPDPLPRYALDALLAQCDPSAATHPKDQAWCDLPGVGRELI